MLGRVEKMLYLILQHIEQLQDLNPLLELKLSLTTLKNLSVLKSAFHPGLKQGIYWGCEPGKGADLLGEYRCKDICTPCNH